MSNTKESVTSLLVIIAFLALTAIAAVLYGGSQDQQSQLQNNWLWQKARWALDTAWSAVPGIINSPDQSQNAVAGPTASGGSYPYNPGADVATTVQTNGFWSGIMAKLQAEWDKSVTAGTKTDFGNSNSVNVASGSNVSGGFSAGARFFDWQRTDTGAEITFRWQNVGAFTLPLPFKVFSNQTGK